MEIDVKNVSERGGQPGRRQKKSLPPRTDAGRCIAMGGVVAPAGYKEPTGDSPPASECSDVFEAAEAEVERLNKTTSEKVALRHWTSDERINGYENEPSVWTRPTVEALLPYNRRRREGGATARARARARGGKEEKRPSRTALKQARAVKTGQVQLQRRAPRLPREHGGREGGGGVGGTVRQPTWTPQASQITDLRINAGQKVYDRYTKNSAVQHHGGNPRICRCHPQWPLRQAPPAPVLPERYGAPPKKSQDGQAADPTRAGRPWRQRQTDKRPTATPAEAGWRVKGPVLRASARHRH